MSLNFMRWKLEPADADKDTPESIFEHNLRVADKAHDLTLFGAAAMAYRELHPTKNVQAFERLLRTLNLNAHVIAKSDAPPPGMRIVQPWAGNAPARYNVWFSVRPREHAMLELRTAWPSYEANYEALADCGIYAQMIADDDADTKQARTEREEAPKSMSALAAEMKAHYDATSGGDFLPLDGAEDQAFIEQVTHNKARVARRTAEEQMRLIMDVLTKELGARPREEFVGFNEYKKPIMALIGKEGLTSYGYTYDDQDRLAVVTLSLSGRSV